MFLKAKNVLNAIGLSFIGDLSHKFRLILSTVLFRSKVPFSLIFILFLINIPMQGELIGNPLATGIYFVLDIYALAGIVSGKEYWELIFNSFPVLLKTVCAIAFSYSFIGIAENKFSSYNSKLRFVSDGSYWIYLIHLPVVSFLTFSMFTIPLWIELKFLISIFVTTIFGLFTYKYLVRSTVVGVLLNGKRIPFNRSNWFN